MVRHSHLPKHTVTDQAVTIVSPNSYFSFTPFLASTTVGTLEYRCATEPVRGIKGAHFAQAWADRIGRTVQPPCFLRNLPRTDFGKKVLTVESAVPPPTVQDGIDRETGVVVREKEGKEYYEVPYDKLVIAVGCYSASLGIEGVRLLRLY